MHDQHDDQEEEQPQPAAICGETSLGDCIGGEDRQPPLPADNLFPSDALKPGEKE